jgi:hypothetical protein
MRITRAWLKGCTRSLTPSRDQVLILGIKWPLQKGWFKKLLLTDFPNDVAGKAYITGYSDKIRTKSLSKKRSDYLCSRGISKT